MYITRDSDPLYHYYPKYLSFFLFILFSTDVRYLGRMRLRFGSVVFDTFRSTAEEEEPVVPYRVTGSRTTDQVEQTPFRDTRVPRAMANEEVHSVPKIIKCNRVRGCEPDRVRRTRFRGCVVHSAADRFLDDHCVLTRCVYIS